MHFRGVHQIKEFTKTRFQYFTRGRQRVEVKIYIIKSVKPNHNLLLCKI